MSFDRIRKINYEHINALIIRSEFVNHRTINQQTVAVDRHCRVRLRFRSTQVSVKRNISFLDSVKSNLTMRRKLCRPLLRCW